MLLGTMQAASDPLVTESPGGVEMNTKKQPRDERW